MTVIKAGTAVYIEVNARKLTVSTKPLFNPSGGVKVTLRNPSGAAMLDSQPMANPSTGVYTYTHQTDTDEPKGMWTMEFKVVDGSYTHLSPNAGSFLVV